MRGVRHLFTISSLRATGNVPATAFRTQSQMTLIALIFSHVIQTYLLQQAILYLTLHHILLLPPLQPSEFGHSVSSLCKKEASSQRGPVLVHKQLLMVDDHTQAGFPLV